MASGRDDPDRELAVRARRGDRNALAQLYDGHKGKLLGFIQRMTIHRGIAEDVFQDVWVKVMSSIIQYEPERGPFHGWLYRIASNAAVDRLRAESHRNRRIDEEPAFENCSRLEAVASDGKSPDEEFSLAERRNSVEAALTRLEPNPRVAIVLRHQAGFTYPEISRILQVPEGTVKTMVHRGILAVRSHLDEENS